MYSIPQHSPMHYAYPSPVPAALVPTAPVSAPTRQYSNHSNSSAFSSSANPDEDWTKISDLAERRRIQNRIAQRNYRKKLKRRLEDLERRAGSSNGSPSPDGSGIDSSSSSGKTTSSRNGSSANGKPKAKKQQHTLSSLSAAAAAQQQQQQQQQHHHQHHHQHQRQASPYQPQTVLVPPPKQSIAQSQFTPPLHPEDDLLFAPAPAYDARSRSHTPPSMFGYQGYPPPPEDMLVGAAHTGVSMAGLPATSTPSYRHDAPSANPYEYHDWTMAGTVPVTLPSMHDFGSGLTKRISSSSSSEDDAAAAAVAAAAAATTMAPYMSYGFLATTGMDAANPYDSNPHTPPLSHSYDHSTNCSDAGLDYPTTPLSMASPGIAA